MRRQHFIALVGVALRSEGNRTMSEPVWNKFLTERDKAVFAVSGYGARGASDGVLGS